MEPWGRLFLAGKGWLVVEFGDPPERAVIELPRLALAWFEGRREMALGNGK